MKIGIIGTGRMGSGLGKLWAAKGHTIMFGARDLAKAQRVAATLGASAGTPAEAVAFGEVILLAVPWTAAQTALQALGSLAGKVLIDLTNAFGADGGPALLGQPTSGAEQIAGWAPGARVVKAFNGIYYEHLGRSQFQGQAEGLFYCGDDPAAKALVAQLGTDAGFDPVDCGPLTAARLVEPLGFLWMQLAFRQGHGPDTALKLLRR
jgi:predicted dinucleotide-binding enzyme